MILVAVLFIKKNHRLEQQPQGEPWLSFPIFKPTELSQGKLTFLYRFKSQHLHLWKCVAFPSSMPKSQLSLSATDAARNAYPSYIESLIQEDDLIRPVYLTRKEAKYKVVQKYKTLWKWA